MDTPKTVKSLDIEPNKLVAIEKAHISITVQSSPMTDTIELTYDKYYALEDNYPIVINDWFVDTDETQYEFKLTIQEEEIHFNIFKDNKEDNAIRTVTVVSLEAVIDSPKDTLPNHEVGLVPSSILEHAVRPTPSGKNIAIDSNRIVYHLGVDDMIYVIGISEDLSDKNVSLLNDGWKREDVTTLSTDDYRYITSNEVTRLKFDRAIDIQDSLENIIRMTHGCPTLIAVRGEDIFYLPINHSETGKIGSMDLISLDLLAWSDSKLMLPHEIDTIVKESDNTTEHVITLTQALALQMSWIWEDRQ